ncbi:hypothetical protein F4776DRAFT_32256 [Hypoxylon sp. NC0597]|nr:hypothetical protein F4776DRAFT_32256 [Hypoxylon sp. NC0597]
MTVTVMLMLMMRMYGSICAYALRQPAACKQASKQAHTYLHTRQPCFYYYVVMSLIKSFIPAASGYPYSEREQFGGIIDKSPNILIATLIQLTGNSSSAAGMTKGIEWHYTKTSRHHLNSEKPIRHSPIDHLSRESVALTISNDRQGTLFQACSS